MAKAEVVQTMAPPALGADAGLVSWLRTAVGRPTALVGAVLVGAFVVLAIVGPAVAPYGYTEFASMPFEPPSQAHWFGTDQYGRDVFSRVLVGTRELLTVAPLATLVGVALGTLIGLFTGYYGGWLDEIVMRVMDGLMSFPALLLSLLLLATLGDARLNVVIAIGIVNAPRVARVIRSAVLDVRTREFIQAARVRGESTLYILGVEILPNILGTLFVEASLRFVYAIFAVASLGFLGMGVHPPSPDWGLMVAEGRDFVLMAPWMVLFPSAAIALLVIGTNLLTDGIARSVGVER